MTEILQEQSAPAPTRSDQVKWSLPKWIAAPVKLFGGMALAQSLVGAIVLMGWLWRVSQRFVFKAWWKKSRAMLWNEFVSGSIETAEHRAWPNLVFGRRVFGALWMNLKMGARAFSNTSVIMAPACMLWVFSWYDGWNNSFNKGYEQAMIGPATGVAGLLLFIAAMFYLPMAQMRHAATGDWRSFYQFRLVWMLIRRSWLQCFGLAVLIVSLSLPLMIMKTAPGFFTSSKDAAVAKAMEEMPPGEALGRLQMYYFWCGLYLIPALLISKWASARVYAGAIVDSVQKGAISPEVLHENEWKALHRLNLLTVQSRPAARHWVVRAIAWAATRAGAVTIGFAIFFAWFGLVAQIYASEFIHKTDMNKGWWNQPMAQLPWFNFIPGRLEAEAQEARKLTADGSGETVAR